MTVSRVGLAVMSDLPTTSSKETGLTQGIFQGICSEMISRFSSPLEIDVLPTVKESAPSTNLGLPLAEVFRSVGSCVKR